MCPVSDYNTTSDQEASFVIAYVCYILGRTQKIEEVGLGLMKWWSGGH